MRVLAACSLGGAGHLHPLLPLLGAARRRGDEVLVVGPPALADLVARTGYAFRAGGEPPESVVAPIREQLPVVPPAEASVLANRELFGRLATQAMRPAMEAVFDEWRPDLVLREPCEYASAVVAAGRGVATAQVAISVAEGEAASIATAAPALEAHRPGLVERLRASPYLTRMPASLDPSPFPTTVRMGPDGRGAGSDPPPQWWADAPPPRVYVSFGTVLGHMTMARAVFRTVVAAAAEMPGTVLLTVGRTVDPSGLGPVPPHVRIEPWVDQASVVGQADAVVCHAGSGTAFGALAAGVPLVMMPLFADQRTNAVRIAAAGAGLAVAPPEGGFEPHPVGFAGGRPVRVQLDAAVRTVLAAPGYRAAAGRIGAEMAAAPSVDDALAAVSPGPAR